MRKRRQFKAGRCYHLVSRIAHRAFFFDEEEKNPRVFLAQHKAVLGEMIGKMLVNRIAAILSENQLRVFTYDSRAHRLRDLGDEELDLRPLALPVPPACRVCGLEALGRVR